MAVLPYPSATASRSIGARLAQLRGEREGAAKVGRRALAAPIGYALLPRPEVAKILQLTLAVISASRQLS
jgi:hypothetical protein